MQAVFLLILLIGVLVYQWFSRRGSTLTRMCRWRLDRSVAADHWRCAACGAEWDGPTPRARPRDCLRTRQE